MTLYDVEELKAEAVRLRFLVDSLSKRVHAQSELLSKRAEVDPSSCSGACARNRRLREALTWAVGFIQCQMPRTSAEYPDMRNCESLIAEAGAVNTGEFRLTCFRAELAEEEVVRLRALVDSLGDKLRICSESLSRHAERNDAAADVAGALRRLLDADAGRCLTSDDGTFCRTHQAARPCRVEVARAALARYDAGCNKGE